MCVPYFSICISILKTKEAFLRDVFANSREGWSQCIPIRRNHETTEQEIGRAHSLP